MGAVVENKVDTSKLLESLKETSGSKSFSNIAFEAIEVGGFAETQFILVVGMDFTQFILDGFVIDRKTAKFCKRLGSSLGLATFDEVTGRLGKDKHPSDQDQSPCELDCDGDAIGTTVASVVSCIVDDVCQEETNSDGKLVRADDDTTNPFWSSFGLIQRN